jgi:hypothetical protein
MTSFQTDPDDEADTSPVGLVHRLGVYVHSSPQRMEEFERIRSIKNPETPKGLLPLKDVVTRWNSKEAAIARVLRLRATVEIFTTRATSKKCPRFDTATFDALALVQGSLKVFLTLTQVYSGVGAHAYRIIPDLVTAVGDLERIHAHPSVSSARVKSGESAVKKFEKYIWTFIENKWVTAAFALDPSVRELGLEELLTEHYEAAIYLEETINFIKERIAYHQDKIGWEPDQETDEVTWVVEPKRRNPFASSRYQLGQSEPDHDKTDPWACYNSDSKRFAMAENEPVLVYWKRMADVKELRPLALAARDILGLASSSASVERLFSQSGFVLGRKRGSMSARMLTKQTSLRVWEQQGFLTTADL